MNYSILTRFYGSNSGSIKEDIKRYNNELISYFLKKDIVMKTSVLSTPSSLIMKGSDRKIERIGISTTLYGSIIDPISGGLEEEIFDVSLQGRLSSDNISPLTNIRANEIIGLIAKFAQDMQK